MIIILSLYLIILSLYLRILSFYLVKSKFISHNQHWDKCIYIYIYNIIIMSLYLILILYPIISSLFLSHNSEFLPHNSTFILILYLIIQSFYLIILFISHNSDLFWFFCHRIKKSIFKLLISQFWIYISQLNLIIVRVKSLYCEIKMCNYLLSLFNEGNNLS